jgi:hypothetical protein
VDVTPTETTHYTITGLALNTEYSFSVMAKNRLGGSSYLSDNVRAKTSSKCSRQLNKYLTFKAYHYLLVVTILFN